MLDLDEGWLLAQHGMLFGIESMDLCQTCVTFVLQVFELFLTQTFLVSQCALFVDFDQLGSLFLDFAVYGLLLDVFLSNTLDLS